MPWIRQQIRQKVEALLRQHGIRRAPVDVHALALKLGARVQFAPSNDDLSGFLLRDSSTQQVIIGVNSTHSSVRRRFTIAHELGHLLLHHDEVLHVDRRGSGFEVHQRNARSSDGTDPREIEANAFAGELLMPRLFLDSDLKQEASIDLSDDGMLKRLADRYKVSTTAMSIRLASLGYVQILPNS